MTASIQVINTFLGEVIFLIPFATSEQEISDNICLTIMDIDKIDSQVKRILDGNFVTICEGNSGSQLSTVKQRVRNLYSSKRGKNDDWVMGATAEFFVHLYIALSGFKQECLFLNLEEGSIKKGFDGFYSKGTEEWLMESKAGSIKSKDICHSGKIKIAMSDLKKKVSGKGAGGKSPNNPWQNAYSHANSYDVGASDNIRKNLKKLADEFTNGTFYDIAGFNTMPCSTIFLSGVWMPQVHKDIEREIQGISRYLKGKQIHVICVTQKSVNLFLDYIEYRG